MEFYYSDTDGQAVGPVSQVKLEALLQHGILNAQSLIAPVGESQWKTLATLFQIDTFEEPEAPQFRAPPPVSVNPHSPGPAPRTHIPNRPASVYASPMPAGTQAVLASTSLWANLASIYWWVQTIGTALVGLLGIYIVLQIPRDLGVIGYVAIGAVVLAFIMAGLYMLPAMQSRALAARLSEIRQYPGYLELVFRHQAIYFRTLAIYLILVVCFLGGCIALAFSQPTRINKSEARSTSASQP